MASLTDFAITTRWVPQHPDRIQLYSLPTPNGQKVSAILLELDLPFEAHRIDFGAQDQMTPEFLSLNPNNKIPAIIDPNGPDGAIGLWESGAILVYLAEKAGKLIPADPVRRYETLQWLMFQMGGVGPMFGQFGHFYKFARDKTQDDYGIKRYTAEVQRLLKVLDDRLDGRQFIMGDLTIADFATYAWTMALDGGYGGAEVIGIDAYRNVLAWRDRCGERDSFARAKTIPPRS